MTVWSIDPGETTGLVQWTDDGLEQYRIKYSFDDLTEQLSSVMATEFSVKTVVIEQWGFMQGKTQQGNKMVSSQVIGMLRLFAHHVGAEVVFQEPRILKISALHTGTPVPKSGHFDDAVSAYLHGHYYFVVKGILSARTL